MCTKTHNHEVQSLRYRVRDRIFCHFGPFLPFYPPNNPENQNFEKMKKESGDDIILHMCTKITIMMHASWNMKCNRHIFFVILGHCLLFHSYNPKNQKFEKMKKKHLELSSFYKFTKNHVLCSQDMVYGRCNCFILGYFLPFYPTNSQKNQII